MGGWVAEPLDCRGPARVVILGSTRSAGHLGAGGGGDNWLIHAYYDS